MQMVTHDKVGGQTVPVDVRMFKFKLFSRVKRVKICQKRKQHLDVFDLERNTLVNVIFGKLIQKKSICQKIVQVQKTFKNKLSGTLFE